MRKILYAFLILFFFNSQAWSAYPSYTVCPSSCDFTTLHGAVADIIANHATLGSPTTITISGNWSGSPDTTAVDTSGITASSSNTLTITTTGLARHNGVYSTSYYILKPSTGTAMSVNSAYTTVDGLEFNPTADGADGLDVGNFTNITVSNNIFKGGNLSGNANRGILANVGGYAALIYNNIIYSMSQHDGIYWAANSGGNTCVIYNNTVYGGIIGSRGIVFNEGTFTAFNNIANNNNGGDYVGAPQTHGTNISQDASSPDGAAYQGANGTATFVSSSAGNFNLSPSDTAAKGRGANLSGTFTTDITGALRTSPWDIGAFKFIYNNQTIIVNATVVNATIN